MGEEVCVEDTVRGECGRRGLTLKEHCHADITNGGCRLYWTKKGSTPVKFRGFTEAVFVCRARQNAGLDLTHYPLPYWAEKAYLIGNAVYNQVENSPSNEDDEQEWQVTGKGDSGAFALINEHMKNMGAKRIN